jgi:hypothetical protein
VLKLNNRCVTSQVCFFCYPAICSKAFATFICTTLLEDDLSGNDVAFSVLVADDRVRCEATSHRALEVATFAVIVLFAFGVPIGAAVFLRNALGKQPEPDKRLQYRVASDFNLDLQAASDLIQDIRASSKYGFLVGAYRPSVYFWESIDMLRSTSPKQILTFQTLGPVSAPASGYLSDTLPIACRPVFQSCGSAGSCLCSSAVAYSSSWQRCWLHARSP